MSQPMTLPDAVAQMQVRGPGRRAELIPVTPQQRQAAVLMLFGDRHNRPNLDPASVPVDELDIVLELRAGTLRSHPGEVSFPGGGRDAEDADMIDTALREAAEEIGLRREDARVLGTLTEIGSVSQYRITPVVAWRTREAPLTAIDAAETSEVHRVALRDLLHPAHRFTSVYRHPTGVYRGPAFDVHGLVVWGFTAGVLDRFFEVAGWTIPWERSLERDV